MALQKTYRSKYQVDVVVKGRQAQKALKDIESSIKLMANDLQMNLKGMSSTFDSSLSKLVTLLEKQYKTQQSINKTKKQSTAQDLNNIRIAKEKNKLANELLKLEKQTEKLKSAKSYKASIARYTGLLKQKNLSDDKRNEYELKQLASKINYQKAIIAEDKKEKKELEQINKMLKEQARIVQEVEDARMKVKLAVQEGNIQQQVEQKKREREEANRLYEIEKKRIEVIKAENILKQKPPTTAGIQREEYLALERLMELEKKRNGETKKYLTLKTQMLEKQARYKKTIESNRKEKLNREVAQVRAIARKEQEKLNLKAQQNLKSLKQSDILRGEIKSLEAELKVLKDIKYVNETITAQNRLQAQLDKKRITLNKTIKTEQQAIKDKSLLGTLSHAIDVAPVYMAVAQAVNVLQGALSSAVSATIEFDNTMRVLSAVTGETITKTEELTHGVMLLGEAYGGSLSDYAKTVQSLARAGINTDELVKATEVTAQLGLITGDSIDSASNAIISYSQVYQKAGNKIVYTTQQLGDKLAYMANASRLSTEDIGTLSNYALASSKSIGMSVDVVNGLAVAFSNAGNNASTIGTQIRRFTSTLTSSSTSIKEFYSKIGVNRQQFVNDLLKSKSGNIDDIEASNKAFEEFVLHVQSLSENEYRQAIQGMNILDNQFFNQLRNNGDEIIAHITKSFSDLNGELDKTAVISQGLGKRWEEIGNRILNGLGPIGNVVGDNLTAMAENTLDAFAMLGQRGIGYFEELIGKDVSLRKSYIDTISVINDYGDALRDSSKSQEEKDLTSVALMNAKKYKAMLEVVREKKEANISLTNEEQAQFAILYRKYEEYQNLLSSFSSLDKTSRERKLFDLQKEVDLIQAQTKALTEKEAKEELINKLNEYKDKKATLDSIDKQEQEFTVKLLNDEVLELTKQISLLSTKAGLSTEEVNQLKIKLGLKKEIVNTLYSTNSLTKEEVQSAETLARSLANTTDLTRLMLGFKAIDADLTRNNLASQKYLSDIKQQEIYLSEVSNNIDLEKLHIGSETISNLIQEKNYQEALSAISLAKLTLEQEDVKLKDEQVAIKESLKTLNGQELQTAIEKLKEIEKQRQVLTSTQRAYSNILSLVSNQLKITNSLTSANRQVANVIGQQLAPLREITNELRRQHSIKIANAGLDKIKVIGQSKEEELKSLAEGLAKSGIKFDSSTVGLQAIAEAEKMAKEIVEKYDKLETQARIELNKKKVRLEKELQSDLFKIGKTGKALRIAELKKELENRKQSIKGLYRNNLKEQEKYLAEAQRIYQDKVKKLDYTSTGRHKSWNSPTSTRGETKRLNNLTKSAELNKKILEYRRLLNGETVSHASKLKAEIDSLKKKAEVEKRPLKAKEIEAKILEKQLQLNKTIKLEKEKAFKLDITLQKQALEIASKQELLKTGKVDKLSKLNAELNILKQQYEVVDNTKDKNNLTIKILDKQIEKEKEINRLKEKQIKEYIKVATSEYKARIEQIKGEQKQYKKAWEERKRQAKIHESAINKTISGVIDGKAIGKSIVDGINSINSSNLDNFKNIFSKTIADSFKTGFDLSDLAIFNEKGGLTNFGQSAIGVLAGIGKTYALGNTADDQAGEKIGKEIGSTAGTMIGTYFGGSLGGVIGDAVGTALGGAVGRGFGGTKSQYVQFNGYSGYLEQRTSGGQWRHDKYKVLETETQNFLYDFEKTKKLYADMYYSLGLQTQQLDLEAKKYNSETFFNEVIPKEFIADVAGLPKTITTEITKTFFDETTQSMVESVTTTISNNPELDKIYNIWKLYADRTNTTVTEAIVNSLNSVIAVKEDIFQVLNKDDKQALFDHQIDNLAKNRDKLEDELNVTGITLENFSKMYDNAIKSGDLLPDQIANWESLGRNLIDTANAGSSFADSLASIRSAYDSATSSLSNYLATRGQEGVELASTKVDIAKSEYETALEELGLSTATTIEDLQNEIDTLIDRNTVGFRGSDLTDTETIAISEREKEIKKAIDSAISLGQAEDSLESAREKAYEDTVKATSNTYSYSNSIDVVNKTIEKFTTSDNLKQFTNWKNTWKLDELETTRYNIEQAFLSHHEALAEVGLESATATEYIQKYTEALKDGLTKDEIEKWDNLGDSIKSVWEEQQHYIDILDDQKDKLKDFTDWNNLLGLNDLESAKYRLDNANLDLTEALNLPKFTLSTITAKEYIEHFSNAIENDFVDSASINDWETLGEAIKSATEAEREYKEALEQSYRDRFALLQDDESGIISIYNLIEELQSPIDEYNKLLADEAEEKLKLQEEYNQKVIDTTKEMFDSAIESFQNTIDKLKGSDDPTEDKRQQLIAFNKAQAEMDRLLGLDTIDTEAFSATYQDLLGSADTLGSNLQDYLNSTELKDSLLATLISEQTKISSSDAQAFVEQQEYESKITEDLLSQVADSNKYLDYLNGLVATDSSVTKLNDDFIYEFGQSQNLSAQQFAELIKISNDGYLTLTEVGTLTTLSSSTIDILESQTDLFAKDSSIRELIEVVRNLNLNVDILTTTSISSGTSGALTSTYVGDGYTSNIYTALDGSTYTDTSFDSGASAFDISDSSGTLVVSGGGLAPPLPTQTFSLFASGGYTGDYPTNKEVGVVHGQEYVIPAKGVPVLRENNNTVRIFNAMLEEIRSLREEVKDLKRVNIINAEESRKSRKINQQQLDLKYQELSEVK